LFGLPALAIGVIPAQAGISAFHDLWGSDQEFGQFHGVIPAQAGIQFFKCAAPADRNWIPACAGMTL